MAAMVLPFKRYADFSGRSTRMEYWMFTLLWWAVIIICLGLIGAGMPPESRPDDEQHPLAFIPMLILLIWWVGTILPCIALTVRRLHDQNKSGALTILFYLLSIILSFVGWIVQTVFMCLEGTRGPNQYGPDPLGDGSADIFA